MRKLTIYYLILLTALFYNTSYSRQDTMPINNSIISLINELNSVHNNIINLEKIFGCKFYKNDSPKDELDLLLDDNTSSTDIFTCNKVKDYPQISNIKFEIHIFDNKRENFLSVTLNEKSYIKFSTITDSFGDKYELLQQAHNVPENKRCYIAYKLNNKLLTFGFQSCDNLNEVSYFNIREYK